MAEEKEKQLKSETALREEKILEFWQKERIFEKTLIKDAPNGNFVFFDGPPFATGLPHYGHILAGTIKDVIPRYKTMQGFHVPRQWGWDCHGLPIENIVEKELGFKHKKEIKEYGIEKFNEKCREQVLMYAHEWEKIIPRMGRFVDMTHPYRTMDRSFMESVWWVFKQLWDKGLVYEDYRSMHVCPRCETTLSQQEVSEGYKDVKDISVTVKFELVDEPGTFLLAWTTTPWTLPGNVALAINENATYAKYEVEEEIFIVAKESTQKYPGQIIGEILGKELVGKKYKPPFDYYIKDKTLKNHENGWKVYHADFVTEESGTGIAHEAPAFGADDWELLKKENLPFVQHVNIDGTMKEEVVDFAGFEVKPKSDDDKIRLGTDIAVLKYLQDHGTFFSKENINHTYPHCWRCDSPLLNYATSSWFVNVTKIKGNLLKNAESINWSPEHIKEGRFGKWLEGARDWSISRQRFWASAIPIWIDQSGNKYVIGSIDELKTYVKKSGNRYFVMRHGQTEGNVKKIWSTDSEFVDPLTETGREQVHSSAKEITEKIDLIITSPFSRTQETTSLTAEILGIPVENIIVDPCIGEWNVGAEYNGKNIEEFFAVRNMSTNRFTFKTENGESYADVCTRAGKFLYLLEEKYKGKNILIVTHGAPARAMSFIADGFSHEKATIHMKTFKNFNNAEIREIDFVPLPHNKNYELDIHRPYIDDIELVNENGEAMKRVSDVLDTWFDSGSMPYGKENYPFENKEKFENNYPAQFIAEGVDQTRAWFYYLHVLAEGLFEKNAFQNVIVNGVVLAEDGKKMSKKLQNYPDPMMIMNHYGADAMRYYMLSSPIVKAEDLNFSEQGVDEVHKKIIGKLTNILSFYEMYNKGNTQKGEPTILDQWILSRLAELRDIVTTSLDTYELDRATRPVLDFVDDFSVWYVRRSRERFKSDDKEISSTALWYTAYVLKELSKIIAPFMPFVAEYIFQTVKEEKDVQSVHLSTWPDEGNINTVLLSDMQKVRDAVSNALQVRSKANIKVRQPLASLVVKEEFSGELRTIIADEVNVKEVTSDTSMNTPLELDITLTPDLIEEGTARDIIRAIQDARKKENLQPSQVVEVLISGIGQEFLNRWGEMIQKPTGVSRFIYTEEVGVHSLVSDTLNMSFSLGY
ncbi:MAG: class I tRNA ligase family protein [Minisyncoccota bacterium]